MESEVSRDIGITNQDINLTKDMNTSPYTFWSVYYTRRGGITGWFHQEVFLSRYMTKIKIEERSQPIISNTRQSDFDALFDYLSNDRRFFRMESPIPPRVCPDCYNVWITISAPANGEMVSNTLFYYSQLIDLDPYIRDLINLIEKL
ncbi:hypothetical protein [Candidatus Nitrosocosmicus hydrocola]|uniref:hypothetical protein n=1 Tax=Candidatus Nitrosocosmicus hydrocola TaxID=1826872 RepID=UPI0011E5B6E9|nr:hypothetical protein [Candidatus Nitrosocosmicus hydrocola]